MPDANHSGPGGKPKAKTFDVERVRAYVRAPSFEVGTSRCDVRDGQRSAGPSQCPRTSETPTLRVSGMARRSATPWRRASLPAVEPGIFARRKCAACCEDPEMFQRSACIRGQAGRQDAVLHVRHGCLTLRREGTFSAPHSTSNAFSHEPRFSMAGWPAARVKAAGSTPKIQRPISNENTRT